MYVISQEKVLNLRRIVFLEIDKDTPSEINYFFEDGAIYKEQFQKIDKDNGVELARQRFESICEKNKIYIRTNNNELINPRHIKEVWKDVLDPLKMVFIFYSMKPLKEKFGSEEETNQKVKETKEYLDKLMDECGAGDGEAEDKFGNKIALSIDKDYIMKLQLININGVVLSERNYRPSIRNNVC